MRFLVVLLPVFLSLSLCAQDKEAYSKAKHANKSGDSLQYVHRAPAKMEPGKKYPLIVFFHGAGGRGNDNMKQMVDGGTLRDFTKAGIGVDRPCYVIAGQVPRGQQWVDVPWSSLEHNMPAPSKSMKLMLEAVDAYIKSPDARIDTKRVYVMGFSMGGYGTWDAMQRRPELFAAAVPICGGGDKTMGKAIAKIPTWAWHGDKDGVIKPSRSRDMVEAMEAAGGSPKYTELKGVGHNAWSPCYASDKMWDWLFIQSR